MCHTYYDLQLYIYYLYLYPYPNPYLGNKHVYGYIFSVFLLNQLSFR